MSREQIAEAAKLIGKMSRQDIAEKVGTSVASLKRAFRGKRLAFYNYCQAKPDLVSQVSEYYETHTEKETADYFNLRPKQVDHIIYRYKMAKQKQIRWSNAQLLEATKMAGLISPKAQARYFNRPNANTGSIKSLWVKRFGMGQCCLNGMAHWNAKELVSIKARYIQPIGQTRAGEGCEFRRIILWTDMEKCLKPEVPEFLQDAIKTLAKFQRWIWQSENPKPLILKMIKAREIAHAKDIA